jgi:hypothetical protein
MFYQFLFAQFPSSLPDMITENVFAWIGSVVNPKSSIAFCTDLDWIAQK